MDALLVLKYEQRLKVNSRLALSQFLAAVLGATREYAE
jgi:hypothetical protein